MSMLSVIKAKLGQAANTAYNFLFDASAADGTLKLIRESGQQVMTVDANGKVAFPQGTAGGQLTVATSQNSTSGTSIDFTGIPSWAKRITVMLNGVSTNGSSPVQIQVGSGGVTTTGYVGGSVLLLASANGISSAATGFQLETSSGSLTSATTRYGSVSMSLQSGNTWVASGAIAHTGSASAGITGGAVSLSGVLDRVRVTTVNGTDAFDAGVINIMYEG